MKKDELIKEVQSLEKTVETCATAAAEAEKNHATKVRKIAKLESDVVLLKGVEANLRQENQELSAALHSYETAEPVTVEKKNWWSKLF